MQAITQIGLFIAQWTLILEILWITAVVVPYTLMATCFYLLDWLILDKLTIFLISGNWNNISTISITANSPIMILFYVAIFLGFLFLIIFFINYFGRNIFQFNISETIKRCFWIFGFILFIVVMPFFLIFFCIFINFITNVLAKIFDNNYLNLIFSSNPDILSFIQTLSNYNVSNPINSNEWNQIWESVTSENDILIKNQIFDSFNKITSIQQNINWDSLVYEILLNVQNPSNLKDIFNRDGIMDSFKEIYNNSLILEQALTNLLNSSIDESIKIKVNNLLGVYNSPESLNLFNYNLGELIINGNIYQTIEIDPNTGQIISTSNIGFILYTAVTGIPVNSINGIWNNITFISTLFNENGIVNLIKSIALGGAVAIATAKGIMQLITLLIYRWMWILCSVPYGAFSSARIVNDNGSIFKIYFRETITSFISLFVVALNIKIMSLLISILNNGFKTGGIVIPGINSNQIALNICFIVLVVIVIYSVVLVTQKILEVFNNSSISRDNSINALTAEYNSFKNQKNNRINQMNEARRSITKNSKSSAKSSEKKSLKRGRK